MKTKLRFTMKNFGIAIRECDDLAHRSQAVKWARLLNELRQDSNTPPYVIEMLWGKYKSL